MTAVQVSKEDRPPYVQFERREVEDRTASQVQGKYVARSVDYVLITPQGSRDCVEREVAVWFPYLEEQVKQGRVAPLWLEGWRHGYAQWQKGEEMPLSGTPVRTWVAITPAQQKLLISLHILTVEDLAQANDEAMQRIGMGALQLKQRAADYLKEANGPGKLVAEVAGMRAELANYKIRNDTLELQNRELMQRLNAQAPPAANGAAATIPPDYSQADSTDASRVAL